ncbi:hibernation-specific plasma protein HP-55-like [Chanos chanos]|uniref:Thyroxine-binding globulin n=1 Tax=Chanos chanos TaxID=29144 RepID=A0A6J2WSW9_CHACN|nr:hibernation-specific plasma protein HP-55-like [Chanos chanos]
MSRSLFQICVLATVLTVVHTCYEEMHRQMASSFHLLHQFHSHQQQQQQQHQHRPSSNGQLLYEGNRDFALRLYKHMETPRSKNLFFSPLSISTALAALSLGAEGETNQQIFSGLGFGNPSIAKEQVHQAFQSLLEDLRSKTAVELKTGTALFLKETLKPHLEFLENLKRFYNSDGFTTDFTKTAEATEMINNYVKEKTNGKINKMVESVNPDTLMVLLSYIYFKGKWEIPFDPRATMQDIFWVDTYTPVFVQMMFNKDHFSVCHDYTLSTSVLQLRFTNSISMMLALPQNNLQELEAKISPNDVSKWQQCMRKSEYNIYVPKLSIKTSYALKDILSTLGMSKMFRPDANFRGISEDQIFVSEAVHQATLDVDETGATAAAVTGLMGGAVSYRPSLILKFNRPFMVLIISDDTNSILFMGKIQNPAEK